GDTDERLLEHEHLPPRPQRRADRDHLLLPTGERPRLLALALREPREERIDALEVLLDPRTVTALKGAHLHVLEHGHAGKEPASLGRLRNAHLDDVVRRAPRDVLALEV